MKLLIAPLHYFANKIDGSEYTRSYEYLEYLSLDPEYSGDVLVAYSDIKKIGKFKIHSFLKNKPSFISIILRLKFIPWVFYKTFVLSLVNKYDCVWHQGPFAINETFSLISIFRNIIPGKYKLVFGPILTPHSVRKINGMGIIKMDKEGKIVKHSIWNEIDLWIYKNFSKSFSFLSNLTLKKADRVLTIDTTGFEMLRNNGITNLKVLTLTLPENNFFKRPRHLKNRIVKFLNVSYLVGRKRTEDIVEAVNILVNKKGIKNIHLNIVGDGPEKEKIAALIEHYKISKYVNLIGLVPRTEVGKYYKESDIFLSGSISDIMPGMYFEAMAASLPMVIAENVTSLEFKLNNFGGFVVEGKKPLAIAEAIIKILSDKNLYYEFSSRNYKLINGRYNFKKGMERLKNEFKN